MFGYAGGLGTVKIWEGGGIVYTMKPLRLKGQNESKYEQFAYSVLKSSQEAQSYKTESASQKIAQLFKEKQNDSK